jgi:hypothetical protein
MIFSHFMVQSSTDFEGKEDIQDVQPVGPSGGPVPTWGPSWTWVYHHGDLLSVGCKETQKVERPASKSRRRRTGVPCVEAGRARMGAQFECLSIRMEQEFSILN